MYVRHRRAVFPSSASSSPAIITIAAVWFIVLSAALRSYYRTLQPTVRCMDVHDSGGGGS